MSDIVKIDRSEIHAASIPITSEGSFVAILLQVKHVAFIKVIKFVHCKSNDWFMKT